MAFVDPRDPRNRDATDVPSPAHPQSRTGFGRGRPQSLPAIPQSGGTYRFINRLTNLPDYIGTATNLSVRIQQHVKSGLLNLETHYVAWQVELPGTLYEQRIAHERTKIDQHRPSLNQRRGGAGRPPGSHRTY